MTKKRISAIIPCYNVATTVSHAIESMLAQIYTLEEIILVDNGSSDETLKILIHYQEKFPDLIKIFHEPKKGSNFARNLGLKMATGTWIQFLDADDILHPNKISEQINLIEQHSKNNITIDFVAGAYWSINENTNQRIQVKVIEDHFAALIFGSFGSTCSNLFSKKALNTINGWDVKKTSSQEYDLMSRLVMAGMIALVDQNPNTTVHVKENSISQSTSIDRSIEIFKNRQEYRIKLLDWMEENHKANDNYIRIYNQCKQNEWYDLYVTYPVQPIKLLKNQYNILNLNIKDKIIRYILFVLKRTKYNKSTPKLIQKIFVLFKNIPVFMKFILN